MAIEELDNLTGGEGKISPTGFFNHILKFDSDNKSALLNLFQYVILAVVPVVIILKLVKEYIPEDDEKKDTLEILLEIIIQLGVLFTAVYFIDKIIRYFPTYSGVAYQKLNEITIILPLLIILFTMQTKLGAKINIIYNRIINLINGKSSQPYVGNTNHGNVKVTQPIVTPGIHQVSRADTLDNSLIKPIGNQVLAQNNISLIDSLPNTMENSIDTGMQHGAMQAAFMDQMEPMAANGALGGAFGSSF